jgi:ATP-dependent DNA helicase RecG
MLNDDELLSVFRSQEADWVERKESARDTDRISEAICAMSNDLPDHRRPGVIFVGQRNSGDCANLIIDDDLLLRLAGLRDSGRIQPLPEIQVQKKVLDGCELAVIFVRPSSNTPVKFAGRTWIRVGPRRALATSQEERLLLEKRQWGNLPYDAQPCLGTTNAELDLPRFQLEFLPAIIPADILIQNHRSLDQQLRTLRLVTNEGTPTNTGILFLAKSPLSWIPNAYVQFRRVEGERLTDRTIDVHEISGTLPDQIRQLDELLKLNVKRSVIIGDSLRQETPDYPIEALRQLMRNAVIHRTYEGTNAPVRITWYSDRVEIQSPGGPFGQVTIENFGNGMTDYRNPTLAGLMVQLRVIERFGVGIQIAREALQRNGNPVLEFQIDQQNVLVVVRTAS